jgi:hypothetical protein
MFYPMVRKSASRSVPSATSTTAGSAAAAQTAMEPKGRRAKPASRPRKSSIQATQVTESPNGHGQSSYEVTRDDIARLAYTFWEQRGGLGGSPDEDWLRAENELRDRISTAA